MMLLMMLRILMMLIFDEQLDENCVLVHPCLCSRCKPPFPAAVLGTEKSQDGRFGSARGCQDETEAQGGCGCTGSQGLRHSSHARCVIVFRGCLRDARQLLSAGGTTSSVTVGSVLQQQKSRGM